VGSAGSELPTPEAARGSRRWLRRRAPPATGFAQRAAAQRRQLLLSAVFGALLLAVLIALDELAFRALLGVDYLRWCLENGALIGAGLALLTFAWGDLNKLTDLIDAHPLIYVRACVNLFPLSGTALSTALEFHHEEAEAAQHARQMDDAIIAQAEAIERVRAGGNEKLADQLASSPDFVDLVKRAEAREWPPHGLPVVDGLLGIAFSYAFVLLFVAWLIVIVPFQYLVVLVAGAPARLALSSPRRAAVRVSPRGIEVIGRLDKTKKLPKGAVESAVSAMPVAFTAAIATGLLLVVSQFVG
jgi:hypothetical protein